MKTSNSVVNNTSSNTASNADVSSIPDALRVGGSLNLPTKPPVAKMYDAAAARRAANSSLTAQLEKEEKNRQTRMINLSTLYMVEEGFSAIQLDNIAWAATQPNHGQVIEHFDAIAESNGAKNEADTFLKMKQFMFGLEKKVTRPQGRNSLSIGLKAVDSQTGQLVSMGVIRFDLAKHPELTEIAESFYHLVNADEAQTKNDPAIMKFFAMTDFTYRVAVAVTKELDTAATVDAGADALQEYLLSMKVGA